MSSASSEELTRTHPGILRWISAFFVAAIIAPVFAPYLWALFAIEGIDGPSLFLGLLFTYGIGLPLVLFGNLLQVMLAVTLKATFYRCSDFQWGLLGAAFGFFMMGGMMVATSANPDMMLVLSAATVGFVAAYIFHTILSS